MMRRVIVRVVRKKVLNNASHLWVSLWARLILMIMRILMTRLSLIVSLVGPYGDRPYTSQIRRSGLPRYGRALCGHGYRPWQGTCRGGRRSLLPSFLGLFHSNIHCQYQHSFLRGFEEDAWIVWLQGHEGALENKGGVWLDHCAGYKVSNQTEMKY